MPVEGFIVRGAETTHTGSERRAANHVRDDFVKVYEQVVQRGGEILAKEVVMTPLTSEDIRYRHDTHIIVDFPE